jgi:hypothetical protein
MPISIPSNNEKPIRVNVIAIGKYSMSFQVLFLVQQVLIIIPNLLQPLKTMWQKVLN